MTTNGPYQRGVRSVALFEAFKGALVLIAGFGLLALVHRDAGELAAELVGRLHLNPGKHYPIIFIDAASRLTDSRLWFIAAMALIYALLRFVEAFGLWREKCWAEWLALVSGGIYLPVEVYEIGKKITFIRVGAVFINLAIVLYMASVLIRIRRLGGRIDFSWVRDRSIKMVGKPGDRIAKPGSRRKMRRKTESLGALSFFLRFPE